MKTIHKLLALALCLALLCGAVSATMRETGTSGLKLADEVSYTHTSWSNDQKEGQYLQEHTLTYTAGGAVRPMVVYGDTLYGRSGLPAASNSSHNSARSASSVQVCIEPTPYRLLFSILRENCAKSNRNSLFCGGGLRFPPRCAIVR